MYHKEYLRKYLRVTVVMAAMVLGILSGKCLFTAAGASGLQKYDFTYTGGKSSDYLSPSSPLAKNSASFLRSGSYPSSYDLRTKNKVTSVKDQGSSGCCWAFSSLGSLESCLLPAESDDFSENYLKNICGNGNTAGGFDIGPNSGGNDLMAIASMARWDGPVYESDDPYVAASTTPANGLTARKHLQNVITLAGRSGPLDNDAIKNAVMSYGAVSVGLHLDSGAQLQSGKYYYYSGAADQSSVDHAADIVGWDDSVLASCFSDESGNHPAGNGAFLVKNSWGTGFGDGGYFYVSYYDTNIAYYGGAVYNGAEPASNYSNIYQYDPFGWTSKYFVNGCNTVWMANVFAKTPGDGSLAAASFYTDERNVSYKIYVCVNYSGTGNLSTSRVLAASGVLSESGYHTVNFDREIAVTGKKFAVIAELTAPSGTADIPVEEAVSGYSSKAASSPGESYISIGSSGTGWEDLTGENATANVCLKAFARLDPVMCVDSPGFNSYISGGSAGIAVSGWALNISGIQSVTASLDGGAPVTLTSGISRPDVGNVFSAWNYKNLTTSGFSGTIPIDMDTLSVGAHTITVTAAGGDGTVQTRTVTVTKAVQAACLDGPAQGSTQTQNISVSGWALNASGVQSVQISVDGTELGTTDTTLGRQDVNAIVDPFGQYLNGTNSGFLYKVPIDSLSAGKHTVSVRVIGNDGEVSTMSSAVTVVKLDPVICIDAPSESATVSDKDVLVSGWAVNRSGIARITVAADGASPKTLVASQLTGRPDVQTFYSLFYDSIHSGFSVTLDKNSMISGSHVITVTATGNDGSTQTFTRDFSLAKPGPVLCVDAPARNMLISGNFSLGGWSLMASGVKEIDVYMDGTLVSGNGNPVKTGLLRPDVARVYPNYANAASCGFSFTVPVDINTLSTGTHTVRIVSIANDGEESSSEVTVVKPSPILCVDCPSQNYVTDNRDIVVGGWAINGSGLNRVVVTLDGDNSKAVTLSGSEIADRPDVARFYPGYRDAVHSGFVYTVDADTLSWGTHTVAITAVGNDGSTQTASRTITNQKPLPVLSIDTPSSGLKVSGNFSLSGYSLMVSGVKEIDVYLDGTLVSGSSDPVATGLARPDLLASYSNYPYAATSGFSFTVPVDINALAVGNHTLKVVSIANDGEESSSEITVIKPVPILCVDSPAQNEAAGNKNIVVGGWAVNASGLSSVTITLDGDGSRTVTISGSQFAKRADVAWFYPEYPGSLSSGFAYTFDVDTLPAGSHTVTITARGNDGCAQSETRTFSVTKPGPVLCVDTPAQYMPINGNFSLSGWSLMASGVKEIQVYFDGALVSGTVTLGISRADVAAAYTNYPYAASSGYSFTVPVDIGSISSGIHTVRIVSFARDGEQCSTTVKVVKPDAASCIDSPTAGQSLDGNTVTVTGWAVNIDGVQSVVAFIDGNTAKAVTATYNLSRPDVGSSYPQYPNSGSSGFSVTLDVSSLSAGTHTITVRSVGGDYYVYDMTVTVTRPPIIYKNYNITLQGMADKNGVSADALDPEHIISGQSSGIYQFMLLDWFDGVTADEINGILAADHQTQLSLGRTKNDIFISSGVNCGESILYWCRYYNINPLYFVCHTILETGHGTSTLANGVYVKAGTYIDRYIKDVNGNSVPVYIYVSASGTYYNFFGIHAYDADPDTHGSQYAASQNWSTIDAGIRGAAYFLYKNYIQSYADHGGYNQDTLYEMKWDPYGWSVKGHGFEYATDPAWAGGIASLMYQYSYVYNGVKLVYNIPRY